MLKLSTEPPIDSGPGSRIRKERGGEGKDGEIGGRGGAGGAGGAGGSKGEIAIFVDKTRLDSSRFQATLLKLLSLLLF